MQRVYLNGGIAQFGEFWEASCTNIRDIFKLIECQTPGFRQYLVNAAENGVGFEIQRGSEFLSETDELLLTLNDEDIIITEVPSGSKSAGAKLLAALAIIVVVAASGGFAGAGFFGTGATTSAGAIPAGAGGAGSLGSYTVAAGGLNGWGLAALSVATNLALTGIAQMMMPGPEVDSGTDESYLFNGPTNNITQGLPVPVLYGELIVGGAPISQYYRPATNQENGDNGIWVNLSGVAGSSVFIPTVDINENYDSNSANQDATEYPYE